MSAPVLPGSASDTPTDRSNVYVLLGLFFVALPAIWSYVWLARPLAQVATLTSFVAVPLFAILLGLIWRSKRRAGWKFTRFGLPLAVITAAVVAFFGGASYFGILAIAADIYQWIRSLSSQGQTALWVAVLTAGLGIVLYVFRFYARFFYGLTELSVGITYGVYRGTKLNFADPALVDTLLPYITAGVYLVVRGLDNSYEGLYGKRPDRLLQALEAFGRSMVTSESPSAKDAVT